jgi:hypothetical protein
VLFCCTEAETANGLREVFTRKDGKKLGSRMFAILSHDLPLFGSGRVLRLH